MLFQIKFVTLHGKTDTPCIKLLICKNRPDEKYWIEKMKAYEKGFDGVVER